MIVGQGKSLMIAVLAACAALAFALLGLFAFAIAGLTGEVRTDVSWRSIHREAPGTIARQIAASFDRHYPASAKPLGNPGAWIGSDDYPAAALRAGDQGRVVVSVEIDTDGTPGSCIIETSSGHSSLDLATCQAITAHGDFLPALDSGGQPMRSRWTSPGVRWLLPG